MILTQIYINNEEIDLKDDVSIPLNFDIADIREPEKKGTTWSKTVILPGSAFNNNLFSNIWNVNAVVDSSGTTNFNPNFNPNLKAKAEIYYNNALQMSGICQLLNVNVTDKYEISYEVAFFGELQNIYQFFTNKYLRDIDLSEYDHTYTLNNQYLSWLREFGNGYVYPHIDYGYSVNSQFRVEHIFPAIYIKTIIDKMFSEAGYSYQSNFFNSEMFKHLILPYSGASTLKLTAEQVRERTMRASSVLLQSILNNKLPPAYTNINFTDKTTAPNFDGGNHWYDVNGGVTYQTFVVPKSGTYTITAFIKANITHQPSTATATLSQARRHVGQMGVFKNNTQMIAGRNCWMKELPASVDIDDSFMFTAGTTSTLTSGTTSLDSEGTFSITLFLNQNDILQFKYFIGTGSYNLNQQGSTLVDTIYKSGGTFQPHNTTSNFKMNFLSDSYFAVALADTNLQEGDDLELNTVLPDKVLQSDFFNSIVKMFNLFVEIDKTNANNLIIEPRPTFYSSGVTRDWSQKLDYSKETKIIPMGELNNKTYLFTYKSDKDYFNNLYETRYNEIYGQQQYDIQNDFLKGEVKNEVIFSPTPLVNTIGHDRVISKIYGVDTNGQIKPTNSNIRILYYGGLKNTAFQWSHIASSGTTLRSDYAYAGHLDDVDLPTFDLSFGVPREVNYNPTRYTANNLYNKYWRDYIEQIADKDSKLFVGYFYLNEFDVQSLDFRDSFFFENEVWRLNKIIDYDRINNQTTKCEFIKLKTLPPYEDDNGIDINGGYEEIDSINIAPTSRIGTTYNNNQVADGALVSGFNNLVSSGKGVIVTGNDNIVGDGSSNISITSSTGVTVLAGISNVSVTNSSGITISESNVTYNNGIKTLNNVSYKKYIALLSQTGINAPTITELETTMSSGITTSYDSVGVYKLISNGEFTIGKTIVLTTPTRSDAYIAIVQNTSSELYINTKDITSDTPFIPNANDLLDNTPIEIRVYS
jgi:hypothetical protein